MSTARGSIRPAEDLSRLERQLVLRVWKWVVWWGWLLGFGGGGSWFCWVAAVMVVTFLIFFK